MGRRLRCTYAAETDVRTGLLALPASTAFHCRYRAFGLLISSPLDAAYGPLQALHVSSGVAVLPDRVNTSTRPPAGTDARQLSVPQSATVCASRTSDVYVPSAARCGDSLKLFPDSRSRR